jgi:hypothetical protein
VLSPFLVAQQQAQNGEDTGKTSWSDEGTDDEESKTKVAEKKRHKRTTRSVAASRSSRGDIQEPKTAERRKMHKRTARASMSNIQEPKASKRKRSASKAPAKKEKKRRKNTKYSAELEILEKFTVEELLTKSKTDVLALLVDSTDDKNLRDWLRDVFLKRLDLTFRGSPSMVVHKEPI